MRSINFGTTFTPKDPSKIGAPFSRFFKNPLQLAILSNSYITGSKVQLIRCSVF